MPADWSLAEGAGLGVTPAEGAGLGVSPMQPRFRAYPKMRNLWVETGATPPPPCGFRAYPRARNLWVETGATPPPPPPHAASPAMSATALHHMQQHLMLLHRQHLRQQGMHQDKSPDEYHSVCARAREHALVAHEQVSFEMQNHMVCVCVCMCARVHVRVFAHACVRAGKRAGVCVHINTHTHTHRSWKGRGTNIQTWRTWRHCCRSACPTLPSARSPLLSPSLPLSLSRTLTPPPPPPPSLPLSLARARTHACAPAHAHTGRQKS
jgi:hypothetical protein